jgi:hypothetical protein
VREQPSVFVDVLERRLVVEQADDSERAGVPYELCK